MSILPVLLLVGVAHAKSVVPHDNDAALQPIATPTQQRRICAELCMSGLGGQACGESCLDILPQGLPLQSANSSAIARTPARRDACPVLCANSLGYPLCQCGVARHVDAGSDGRVDFVQICSYFCLRHSYRVYGCQPCHVYEEAEKQHGGAKADVFRLSDASRSALKVIDWDEWCRQQCLVGNGGAACNCDILPFSMKLDDAA